MAEFGFEFWKRVDELLPVSLAVMAKDLDINYQTLKNQRSDNRYPKHDVQQKIAVYLGTSVAYLLTGLNNRVNEPDPECEYIKTHPLARAIIRAIMEDESLLYPLSALTQRRVNAEEKKA